MITDPALTDLTETSGACFKQGFSTDVQVDVVLTNMAAVLVGNSIWGVSGEDANYDLQIFFSDVDARIDSAALSLTPVTLNVTLADLQQGLVAGNSVTLTGEASLLTSGTYSTCDVTQYLCSSLDVGDGASYNDVNPNINNTYCVNISSYITCGPGKKTPILNINF